MQKISILIFSLLFIPVMVFAQATPPPIFNKEVLNIDFNPPFPQPNANFTATLNDHSLPVQVTNIRWFINGEAFADKQNLRRLELTSPGAGESITVSALLNLANGTTMEVENTLSPAYLDIIIEPQTRTPAFYQGRPLPSFGSTINATALVNGDPSQAGNYIYTWRVNGNTLEGGAIRGRNVVSFTMPRGRLSSLSLEVQRPTGEVVARRLIEVSAHTPQLIFYESSSLYGLRERAIPENLVLSGTTMTVRAEPYHLNLEVFNNPNVAEWEIDNVEQPFQFLNPYEITFSLLNMGARSTISFHVRDTVQVLQGANADFVVTTN